MLICWTFLLAFFHRFLAPVAVQSAWRPPAYAICPLYVQTAPCGHRPSSPGRTAPCPQHILFTLFNLISYNGQGLSPDGDIYKMVDYFFHIKPLHERQLLPCCSRSSAIFHASMEHVEMLLHFPAATEIHSGNPCRA